MTRLLADTAIPDRTDWMSATDRPHHEGVYERAYPGGPYSCWSGRGWNADATSVDDAAAAGEPSRYQVLSWRGLVTPPAEPCATCKGHTVVDRGVHEETGADLIDECPDC